MSSNSSIRFCPFCVIVWHMQYDLSEVRFGKRGMYGSLWGIMKAYTVRDQREVMYSALFYMIPPESSIPDVCQRRQVHRGILILFSISLWSTCASTRAANGSNVRNSRREGKSQRKEEKLLQDDPSIVLNLLSENALNFTQLDEITVHWGKRWARFNSSAGHFYNYLSVVV